MMHSSAMVYNPDIVIPVIALLAPIAILLFLMAYVHRLHTPAPADEAYKAKRGYILTSGYFTGQREEVPEHLGRYAVPVGGYPLYEVAYLVGEKYRTGWHTFAPLPIPDEIQAGTRVIVSYKKRKPWIFEIKKIDF